jgi:hypothetical protein
VGEIFKKMKALYSALFLAKNYDIYKEMLKADIGAKLLKLTSTEHPTKSDALCGNITELLFHISDYLRRNSDWTLAKKQFNDLMRVHLKLVDLVAMDSEFSRFVRSLFLLIEKNKEHFSKFEMSDEVNWV